MLASSVCRVRIRTQQQWNVIVLCCIIDDEDNLYKMENIAK